MESEFYLVYVPVAKTGTLYSGLLLGKQIIPREYQNDYWKPLDLYIQIDIFLISFQYE